MSARGFDLSDLESAANALRDDGHPAAAEAKVLEGLATFATFDSPSEYERILEAGEDALAVQRGVDALFALFA